MPENPHATGSRAATDEPWRCRLCHIKIGGASWIGRSAHDPTMCVDCWDDPPDITGEIQDLRTDQIIGDGDD